MKRLKKAISIMLSFALIAGICFNLYPQEAKAANEILFSVTADKQELKPGDQVTVTVEMSDNVDGYTMEYRMQFDDSRLEIIDYELGNVADGGFIAGINETSNEVSAVIAHTNKMTN